MLPQLPDAWQSLLKSEIEQSYFKNLIDFVSNAYNNSTCFPPKAEIFNAFKFCNIEDVKVVIIGQDPYHNHNQANGLCFSVNTGIEIPPSLKNIYKEIETDIGEIKDASGNLEHWAKQGVFLLNATLTVEAHKPGSHQKQGWETFTDAVIKTISNEREGVVFMLWGGYAKKKVKLINAEKHLVLTSGHPSPLSANRGYWFGNKHFSKANAYLVTNGEKRIFC